MTLPLVQEVQRLEAAPSAERKPVAERRRRARPQRALVVDDYEPVRDMWREWLRRWGFDPDVAENGEIAIAVARARRPLFILMDISMPVMDGVAATRMLKQDPLTADIPVLVVSADTGGPRQHALDAGCAAVIAKPVRASDLLAAIRDALRGA